MKITWLTQRHPPERGGMSCSSERIVNSLRDEGHAVHVIHLTGRPRTVLDSGKEKYFQYSRLTANWNREMVTGVNAPVDPEHLFRVCQNIMKDSILVGFGGGQAGYLAALWAIWLKTGSAVLFRGNDFEKNVHDIKRGWLTHFILKHAKVIGGVSKEMTERLSLLRKGPVVFTPNSIDTTQWKLFEHDVCNAEKWKNENIPGDRDVSASSLHSNKMLEQRKVISIFGQLKSKKGLDLAVDAFRSLCTDKKVFLITVGDLSENSSQYLETIFPADRLHIPFQKRENLPMFFAASDIVFIPSIYDGMPNVLLEAMALGRVVVASRAGGIPDIVKNGENGFLFDVCDRYGAVTALSKAISLDEENRQRVQTCARRTVEEMFLQKSEVHHIEKMLKGVA